VLRFDGRPRYLCRVRTSLFVALLALATGCTPALPPRWAEGGAQLVLPQARWNRGGDNVEIKPNGYVYEDGDLAFVIDRVGRVVDEDFEPVAILLPDGMVAGTDSYYYGRVGVSNASPPDRQTAWLAVVPDGNVIFFDDDGERRSGGRWQGCAPPALRTCTLVTHILTMRDYVRRSESGVSVGIGVGVGVGY
jgi:hypothetical protein